MPIQFPAPRTSHGQSRRSFLGMSAGAAAAFAVAGAPAAASASNRGAEPPLRFGVIADCQYADKPDRGVRLYRQSIGKLQEAVATLNEADLRFALHLGDFIDEFPESFDAVMPIWEQLRMSKFHVLGNHDFQMPREEVLRTMNMPASYHQFRRNGWRFIIVDTNDVSTYGNPEGSANYVLAEKMRAELQAAGKPNGQTWNGGVGPEQLAWIEQTLELARHNGEKVVLNAHHPVFPLDQHNAYNDTTLVDLVTSYDNVVAWFNGHNHAGNYGFAGGTHFITFKGMLDTTVNSYATVQAFDDRLVVEGFGREPNRIVPIGAPAYEV
ncbi:phosphatase [Arthrobacter sp. BB-1]|uniref:metallophosphoesterase n=1 Tax=unclassified Arthrobacter TaxID=235627 RepID=UPI0011128F9C|nr:MULTISPECIES: metallophosphoesterase [unclassified Arthrobacter]TNB72155.1 phosphatase [Arthrobacter sp. BB-1]